MQPKVYSYTRFSDPRQAAGSSTERQEDYARKWAETRGLCLDEVLSLKDEGLSAYHQKHITQGALGTFFRAIEDGQIAPGSVLIVENLDRLSRAEPRKALAQLSAIIEAGITVVTASDNKEYSRENYSANPFDLVLNLLVMIRAHDESETKSKRVIAAIRKQCEGWEKGTFRGQIRNGCDPDWVRWDGSRFVEIPERAHGVKVMIDMFMLGHGSTKIHNHLKATGQYFEKGNIYNIVRRKDLIGQKVISVGGQKFCLEGYYPALIPLDRYHELQGVILGRTRQKGKGEIPGIVTGINVSTCGYCGYTIVSNNLMNAVRKKPDGKPLDGHRRLRCCGQNGKCPVSCTVSAVVVERALLSYCSDQFNLSSLMGSNDDLKSLHSKRFEIVSQIETTVQSQQRLLEAMLQSEGQIQVFVLKQRELELIVNKLQDGLKLIEADIARANNSTAIESSEAWSSVTEGTLSLDYDSRMVARRLVEDTFKQIVIYGRGIQPSPLNKYVDMLLIPHFGQQRWICVDRKSGAWRHGMEITNDLELPFL